MYAEHEAIRRDICQGSLWRRGDKRPLQFTIADHLSHSNESGTGDPLASAEVWDHTGSGSGLLLQRFQLKFHNLHIIISLRKDTS